LPFENLSSDKENSYFTDGVQDEILTDLAKIADLKVISRTSVMQHKSELARNLRKIGEELGVAHVVEGSVQRAASFNISPSRRRGQATRSLPCSNWKLDCVLPPRRFCCYGALKLFPVWDPLRGDPRFEKIVDSLAPK